MSRINCYGDEEIYGEIFPGVFLVRLVNMICEDPEEEYKEGCWGLTFCNDPAFVFYEDPRSEDEFLGSSYQDCLIGEIFDCVRLWNVCLSAGFNPEKHGNYLGYWLVEKIRDFLMKNSSPIVIYQHKSNVKIKSSS